MPIRAYVRNRLTTGSDGTRSGLSRPVVLGDWRCASPRSPPRQQKHDICCAVHSVAPAFQPPRTLGCSDLHVSPLCLGTMEFGQGVEEHVAKNIMSLAFDEGINFFDSAEMYPVPQRAETQGLSEKILGKWMRHMPRDKLIIATKVSGPGGMDWLRGGPSSLDKSNILKGIEGSLQRLGTDCIDLIQLHWPDRYVPMFGDIDYVPHMAYSAVPIEEQLEALETAMVAGKIRHYGLSNETPWGLMKFCSLADARSNPSLCPVSLQNAYHLMCRTFDTGLAECCHLEQVSLLAYSPLAMGLLTGKYMVPGGGPREARLNKYKGRYAEAESRYGPKQNVVEAVTEYVKLAEAWSITPTELALRFVINHSMVAAAVVGVTSKSQLRELLVAAEKPCLEENLRMAVDEIHAKYPNPTP